MERRMRTTAYAMVALMVSAGSVCAQTPASSLSPGSGPPNVTHLHLSAEGAVSEPPRLLVGDLTAVATSPSRSTRSTRSTRWWRRAMKDARGGGGYRRACDGYAVNQVDLDGGVVRPPPHPHRVGWTAQQTLEVRGKDGERLLSLVGKLQDAGLAVASLDWADLAGAGPPGPRCGDGGGAAGAARARRQGGEGPRAEGRSPAGRAGGYARAVADPTDDGDADASSAGARGDGVAPGRHE